VVYDSLRRGGSKKKDKGKRGEVEPEQIELGFGYSFPGSVGAALTLPNKVGLFANEGITQATDTIFDLAQAFNDEQKVTQMARRLGPAPVAAMHRWVKAHVDYHYGVGIEWQRSATQRRTMLVQFEQMEVLRELLSKTILEARLEVTGDLVAVDSEAYTFRIRQDDRDEIEGTYRGAISTEQAARVPCISR
jgi:hypothetical protein